MALVLATATFGNEMEDKTLSYLLLKPMSRWLIALPKTLAPIAIRRFSSVFTWTGLVTTRALAVGLIYVFIWQGLLFSLPEGVRYLSIRAYTLTILHGLDDESFSTLEGRGIELPVAVIGVVAVTVVFFLLTVRRLRKIDVVCGTGLLPSKPAAERPESEHSGLPRDPHQPTALPGQPHALRHSPLAGSLWSRASRTVCTTMRKYGIHT